MEDKKLVVSILVPVYGVEKYIGKCAASLFEQTYENIEYIFVNDHTHDNSISILKKTIDKYPLRKPYVKIISHAENKGLAIARNTALENSSGDYLMHVDADDFIGKNAVKIMLKKAVETDADIVSCNFFLSYGDKHKIVHNDIPEKKEDYIISLLTKRTSPCIWGKLFMADLYKKQKIRAIEGLNYGEDYVTVPRLVYFAKHIVHIDEPLYYYNQYNQSAYTKNISQKSLDQMVWAEKILEEFFSSVPDNEKYTKALILSKLRTKVNLLKRGNKALFKMITSLYPELTVHYRFMLSYKDRILLTLVENHLYTLALIYIRFGFFISRLK